MGSVRNFPVQNHTLAQTCDNERSACDLRHRIYTSNIVELIVLNEGGGVHGLCTEDDRLQRIEPGNVRIENL